MKKEINQVGDLLNFEELKGRYFDIMEIHSFISRSGLTRSGSWGFRDGTIMKKDELYRFRVSGHHHKGHVYILLDWSDTFTIYYVNTKNVIKKISSMVYIDELIETLDVNIERIKEYVK